MADTGQERSNAVANVVDSSSDHQLEEAMVRLRVTDGPEKGSNTANNVYPDRPGEPDCSYYMRTGTCAYGTNCRYNHPTHIGQGSHYTADLPQREGQPECQFFLKTGTCRYGSTCKYHHPREKINTRPVYYNSFGLPIREGEKPCPYYMKTGYCKFSVACKFSHPELTTASGMVFPVQGATAYQPGNASSQMVPTAGLPLVGGFPAWPVSGAPYLVSPTRVQGMSSYAPLMLQTNPNSQSIQPGWAAYMPGNVSQSDVLPGGSNQLPGTINQTSSSSSNSATNLNNNLPERLDQPDCQHYLKTGGCKYGASCKYNHPKDRNPLAQTQAQVQAQAMNAAGITGIGPMGFPSRPGQPICSHYSSYGTCKYGPSCKYDHPVYYNYPIPAYQLPDPYAAAYADQRNSQLILTTPPVEHLGLGFHEQGDPSSEVPQAQSGPSPHSQSGPSDQN
ncbi:Zinc finger CCCH domain-containing protein 3 [Rhynchospora pubera]|uniref:Zinc finger CCCH domain-containing protein 3 n=1 Tax=Rhynchospora pubera TaxID=906938 RepID=A0AAV8E4I3_9POAL|nr:Zinc finger CCCH domain-containing protein 3 [Rhynchospora pubera]KAJ4778724.1 Zinc finger CCCH domain-containing protein 3 [Rhynchospora pubera]KAJ4785600.1 Zinc finger CCCH domain-containing protein 3 [Rhynchospora pubera]KAJ4805573.1 Zinc finger CCCH domain-containing protein 3 [Rhynchospora pubera]